MKKASIWAQPLRAALCRMIIPSMVALPALLASQQSAQAQTLTWTGTNPENSNWNTPALWGGSIPTLSAQAWENTPNGYLTIDNTVAAQANTLIVGRHTLNTICEMTGGTLTTATNGSGLFIGQYSDANGLFLLSGGTIQTTQLSVGMAGPGSLYMTGGNVKVNGVFEVNRYDNTIGTSYAEVLGGTISATNFSLHTLGDLILTNATLSLAGNQTTAVQNYENSGNLTSFGGFTSPIVTSYNATTGTTTVSVNNTVARQAGISAFGSDITGDTPPVFNFPSDSTAPRMFSPVPPPGIHPRIFFGPNELGDVLNRLQTTQVGQQLAQQLYITSGFMVYGHSWYDSIVGSGTGTAPGNASTNGAFTLTKLLPNGAARVGNEGFADTSAVYQSLVSGSTAQLIGMNGSEAGEMAGEMAVEALECLLNQNDSTYATRAQNLARAMDTFANYALANPGGSNASQAWGLQMALSYDLNFWAMTSQQQIDVRKCLAAHLVTQYPGLGVPFFGVVGNWNTLNAFQMMSYCALDGECTTAEDGISAAQADVVFNECMQSYEKFYTYGWYPTGAPYEGMGKNELSAAFLVAYARLGYDFFGHPNLRAFNDTYRPQIMEPYGYGFRQYDDTPGVSPSQVYNNNPDNNNDFIGLKYAFPNDNASDLMFRNFINTDYYDASGNQHTFIDPTKLMIATGYWNDLVMAAIMAEDYSTESWITQYNQVVPNLTFIDPQGGTVISRSDLTTNAMALQFHVRQDFGGHTDADRDTFFLSGLGRTWVPLQAFAANQPGMFSSVVQVSGTNFLQVAGTNAQITPTELIITGTGVQLSGTDMYVTPQDGNKMIIPAKLAGWASGSNVCFATGDATYAYSNQYKWSTYLRGSSFSPSSGYTAEAATFNNFRRSNNLALSGSAGNTPFYQYPYWNNQVWNAQTSGTAEILYGIQKKAYVPMQQVYRTAGLVAGTEPYALVIDDVQKDSNPCDYKWLMQVSNDLTLVTGTNLEAGLDPNTDVVLTEGTSTGLRRLLVRIIQANGTPVGPGGLTGTGTPLAYLCSDQHVTAGTPRNRLVIERTGVTRPGFIVMLYPYVKGGTIPAKQSGVFNGTNLSISIGSQTDSYTFYPRSPVVGGQTVTINEFTLSRGGSTLLDYRNQVEPISIR